MVDAVTGSAPNGAASPANPAVVAAVVANAGTPPASDGAAKPDGSSKDSAVDPFAGLETGTREWVGKKGYKSVSDIAQAALSAESLIGKSVQLPAPDAKPEELDKFYGKLGRPEKADGYEFKLPDGVPAEMPYNGEFATKFKTAAHAAGLTPKQATAAHDFYVAEMAGQFKAEHEKVAQRMTAATETLEKTWGPKDGEKFKDSSAMALRALKGLGIEKAAQDSGLLAPGNLVLDPTIALALEKVGRTMFREDALHQGGQAAGSENPFKDGPGKGNITDQMADIRKDRPAAILKIRAAGFKPEDFGLT